MFEETYSRLTRGDKAQFAEAVSDLLYECYITRNYYDRTLKISKLNPTYSYIDRHYALIEEYLSFLSIVLTKSEEDGVIFISSDIEKNHLKIDSVTTLIVYALRSYYEEQLSQKPETLEVLMTSGQCNKLFHELGLSTATKRLSSSTIADSLRILESFNIVTRYRGRFSESSYSFYILPTIKYVISSEKMNALYQFINGESETLDDQGDLFNDYNMEKEENGSGIKEVGDGVFSLETNNSGDDQ